MKDEFYIAVGGAPITEEYAAKIGADTYGIDAVDSVAKCIALMESNDS